MTKLLSGRKENRRYSNLIILKREMIGRMKEVKEETSQLPSRMMKLLRYLKKTKLSEIEFILFGNFSHLSFEFFLINFL